MKTDGRRQSKNVVVLKTEKDKRQYAAKNKMDVEQKGNTTMREKTRVKDWKSPGTDMGNMIKNSVKSHVPGAALEAGLKLKNYKDTAKPQKLERKAKDDKKARSTKKGK